MFLCERSYSDVNFGFRFCQLELLAKYSLMPPKIALNWMLGFDGRFQFHLNLHDLYNFLLI